MGRAPLLSPEAWRTFERLWCRTGLSADQIRTRILERHGVEIRDPQETAARRGLVRSNSMAPAAREERRQIAALARDFAPRRPSETVRKPAERFRVPEGGYRLGSRQGGSET